MDRLGMLRKMAASKPGDPFPSYGLAMELVKQGEHDEARTTFAGLTERHPDYVATYLMYGNLLVSLGARDDAAAVFETSFLCATARIQWETPLANTERILHASSSL